MYDLSIIVAALIIVYKSDTPWKKTGMIGDNK